MISKTLQLVLFFFCFINMIKSENDKRSSFANLFNSPVQAFDNSNGTNNNLTDFFFMRKMQLKRATITNNNIGPGFSGITNNNDDFSSSVDITNNNVGSEEGSTIINNNNNGIHHSSIISSNGNTMFINNNNRPVDRYVIQPIFFQDGSESGSKILIGKNIIKNNKIISTSINPKFASLFADNAKNINISTRREFN